MCLTDWYRKRVNENSPVRSSKNRKLYFVVESHERDEKQTLTSTARHGEESRTSKQPLQPSTAANKRKVPAKAKPNPSSSLDDKPASVC